MSGGVLIGENWSRKKLRAWQSSAYPTSQFSTRKHEDRHQMRDHRQSEVLQIKLLMETSIFYIMFVKTPEKLSWIQPVPHGGPQCAQHGAQKPQSNSPKNHRGMRFCTKHPGPMERGRRSRVVRWARKDWKPSWWKFSTWKFKKSLAWRLFIKKIVSTPGFLWGKIQKSLMISGC